jgi:hypothetical protein
MIPSLLVGFNLNFTYETILRDDIPVPLAYLPTVLYIVQLLKGFDECISMSSENDYHPLRARF